MQGELADREFAIFDYPEVISSIIDFDAATCCQYSPCGLFLFVGDMQGKTYVLNQVTQGIVCCLESVGSAVISICCNEDNKHVVVGTESGIQARYNMNMYEEAVGIISLEPDCSIHLYVTIKYVSFHPDSHDLVVVSPVRGNAFLLRFSSETGKALPVDLAQVDYEQFDRIEQLCAGSGRVFLSCGSPKPGKDVDRTYNNKIKLVCTEAQQKFLQMHTLDNVSISAICSLQNIEDTPDWFDYAPQEIQHRYVMDNANAQECITAREWGVFDTNLELSLTLNEALVLDPMAPRWKKSSLVLGNQSEMVVDSDKAEMSLLKRLISTEQVYEWALAKHAAAGEDLVVSIEHSPIQLPLTGIASLELSEKDEEAIREEMAMTAVVLQKLRGCIADNTGAFNIWSDRHVGMAGITSSLRGNKLDYDNHAYIQDQRRPVSIFDSMHKPTDVKQPVSVMLDSDIGVLHSVTRDILVPIIRDSCVRLAYPDPSPVRFALPLAPETDIKKIDMTDCVLVGLESWHANQQEMTTAACFVPRPTETYLVSAYHDEVSKLLSSTEARKSQEQTLQLDQKNIQMVQDDLTGCILAGSSKGSLGIYNAQGTLLHTVKAQGDGFIRSISWTRDGSRVVIVWASGVVRVMSRSMELLSIVIPTYSCRKACLTACGTYVCILHSSVEKHQVDIYDIRISSLCKTQVTNSKTGGFDLACHPFLALAASIDGSGRIALLSRQMREKWSAYCANFEELHSNHEYREKESEFDVHVADVDTLLGLTSATTNVYACLQSVDQMEVSTKPNMCVPITVVADALLVSMHTQHMSRWYQYRCGLTKNNASGRNYRGVSWFSDGSVNPFTKILGKDAWELEKEGEQPVDFDTVMEDTGKRGTPRNQSTLLSSQVLADAHRAVEQGHHTQKMTLTETAALHAAWKMGVDLAKDASSTVIDMFSILAQLDECPLPPWVEQQENIQRDTGVGALCELSQLLSYNQQQWHQMDKSTVTGYDVNSLAGTTTRLRGFGNDSVYSTGAAAAEVKMHHVERYCVNVIVPAEEPWQADVERAAINRAIIDASTK